MTIATDTVDREMVEKPRRWDIGFIRKFMMVFGITSSVFDYLTFGVLLFLLPGMIEAIQDRLVYGICYFSIHDSAGNQEQKTFLQEQTRKIPAD